jgi:predicted transcriptional regulator
MLKRHEIQVLRRAAHTWGEIAELSGVSEKTARRIATEEPVTTIDNEAERARRQVGRRRLRSSGAAMAWSRNGIRRLPAWRSISASGSRCAGPIARRRKAASRIWSAG